MEWIITNIGTIFVAMVLAAIVSLIVAHRVVKLRKRQPACSCGCGRSNCAMKGQCH